MFIVLEQNGYMKQRKYIQTVHSGHIWPYIKMAGILAVNINFCISQKKVKGFLENEN